MLRPMLRVALAGDHIAVVIGGIPLLSACFVVSSAAPAQEQGVAPPKKIFARKILMGAIDMNMDEIEIMLAPEGQLNLAEGQQHADTISIMLMAFPHMFPASTTNGWRLPIAMRRWILMHPRTCDQIRRFLSACRGGIEDRFRGQPGQAR